MRYIVFAFTLLMFTCCAGGGTQNSIKNNAKTSVIENDIKSLRTQIKTMIELLDTDDTTKVKSFIENYADPEFVERSKSKNSLDRVTANFMKGTQSKLMQVLLKLHTVEPVIDNKQGKYTFKLNKLKIDKLEKETITFKYINSRKSFVILN